APSPSSGSPAAPNDAACPAPSPAAAIPGSGSRPASGSASGSGVYLNTRATSTYPARSMRSASGGSASVSRRSMLGSRVRSRGAAAGTMGPRGDGDAASCRRPGVAALCFLGPAEPADHLGAPLSQQPPRVSEPDPSPGALNQLDPGLS